MTTPATAVDTDTGRIYLNPLRDPSPEYLSVTRILSSGVPKGRQLEGWFKRITAEYAVDNQHVWQPHARDVAVDIIKNHADGVRDAAADRGSIAHAVLEAATTGQRPDQTWQPDVAGYVDAGLRFLDDWQPTICWAETTVYSDRYGYAGTFDVLAHLAGLGLTMLDWKTGKNVYAEAGLQLSAYRYADYALVDGAEIPLPPVSAGAAVHLHSDGTYTLVPLACGPEQHDVFLHALHVARFTIEGYKHVKGSPLVAPTPAVMVEERRGWLRARVATLRDEHPDALDALALMWPAGVPTLKADGHNLDQLDAITKVICEVEAAHGVPFPPPDPTATSASAELRDAVRARLERLPSDLADRVSAKAKGLGVPHLASPLVSRAHIDRLEPLLAAGETLAGERAALVVDLVAEHLDGDLELRDCIVSAVGAVADTELTDLQVEAFAACCQAVDAGRIGVGFADDGASFLTAPEGEQLLLLVFGSKSQALAACRDLAARHGRPTPRSAAGAAADPVLVALATATSNHNTSDADGVITSQETNTP